MDFERNVVCFKLTWASRLRKIAERAGASFFLSQMEDPFHDAAAADDDDDDDDDAAADDDDAADDADDDADDDDHGHGHGHDLDCFARTALRPFLCK